MDGSAFLRVPRQTRFLPAAQGRKSLSRKEHFFSSGFAYCSGMAGVSGVCLCVCERDREKHSQSKESENTTPPAFSPPPLLHFSHPKGAALQRRKSKLGCETLRRGQTERERKQQQCPNFVVLFSSLTYKMASFKQETVRMKGS